MYVRSWLVAQLQPALWERLGSHADLVRLEFGEVLHPAAQRLQYVWFPNDGVVSQRMTLEQGGTAEVGTIGREGLVGLAAFLGDGIPQTESLVQVDGDAMRMPLDAFCEAVDQRPEFERLIRRYSQAFLSQITQAAACNRLHSLTQRACRWLLPTPQRAGRDTFRLTHEFLSEMLGANRSTVSLVLEDLEHAHLLSSTRGSLAICEADDLERTSRECYRLNRLEYQRLLGPDPLQASARRGWPDS